MAVMTAKQSVKKPAPFKRGYGRNFFVETNKILAELAEQSKEQSKEAEKEYKKTWKIIRELSKNVGGINRTLGKWSEEMIAANICKKINPFGYKFAWCGRNLEFCRLEDGKVFAEVDCFLENGDVVMLVEIKTDLKKSDIDEHLERIKKIRQHLNNRDEKRTIVAAVAGAIVHKSVCIYAQKQGLYVFMQSGETMAVAEIPAGFTPRKWHFALEEH